MAPLLIVFGLFSWYPIGRAVVMSFQKTNLVITQFVGFDNFVKVLNDPLSVRLPALRAYTDLGVYLAALAFSTLIPIALFLVFQRTFLNNAGLGGAVKG